ncbi:MAG: hypothetical protein Q7R40_17500 [Phaeospirillum sp.]|nr:hypothetical protein [Phaeospirillum sp.]
MRRLSVLILALILNGAIAAQAADDAPTQGQSLSQPLPLTGAAPAPPTEETPGFQAVRPVDAPVPAAMPPVPATPPPAILQAPPAAAVQPPPPAPAPAAPAPAAPAPAAEPPAAGLMDGLGLSLPAALVSALMLVLGAAIAGGCGLLMINVTQGRDLIRRRRATTSTLFLELESRRVAFEAVPVPPNAEAGVSFVSAVTALAQLDYGWRAVQGSLHLLPEKLAGHLSVHYAAVHHVANFVKGQSLAAALRMLQANRIGGYPCPDPAAMREAHVELAAAFRGLDKIIQGLKSAG